MSEDGEGLALDFMAHAYTFDGQPVPGVSSIIAACGGIDARWFPAEAAHRGTMVHLAMHLLILGRLDPASVDPRIEGYIVAGRKFIADSGLVADGAIMERPVYHPGLAYAGMPDFIGTVFGARHVVDWKSGATGRANIATAFYEQANRAARGGPVLPRAAVQLKADGRYNWIEYKDMTDYTDAAAMLGVYNAIHRNKGTK